MTNQPWQKWFSAIRVSCSKTFRDFPGRTICAYTRRNSLPNPRDSYSCYRSTLCKPGRVTIRGARRSHTDDVLPATVEFSPRGFQSHGAFLSSVWSVLRSATINYPMAFIVSRRESGAKVRIRRRYPSRGFSTDLRRNSNLADRWIGEWFWKDNSRGIRREWRLCADQSQSSEFNDCIFWIYRARLINITSSLSEPRNYKKFYGDRWF